MGYAVEMIGIDKRFGAVHANRSVDLRFAKGSIHGIVGENGAGKSTVMNILYGLLRADAGEIRIDGRTVDVTSPASAISLGIGMVHQHFMLVEAFTVLENLLLGHEGGPLLARGAMAARADIQRIEDEFGLEIDLEKRVEDLTVSAQQRVEILKALFRGAQVLILDEPTAVLAPPEIDGLFRILRRLRDEGRTVVLITHKLKEVMAVTDRVTVLRHGAVVSEMATAEVSEQTLADAMVGRRVQLRVDLPPSKVGPPLLAARGLTARDGRGVASLNAVDLDLKAGEIVGIAAVAGSGQSELLQVLAGMMPMADGAIEVAGRRFTPEDRLEPRTAREIGIAHVPEDRLRHAVVKPFPAWHNAILGYQMDIPLGRGPLLRRSSAVARARALIAAFGVRPDDPDLQVGGFSGGNQQKLVMGREIARNPDILLVGQPTRGVDVGAIGIIHGELLKLRAMGKAILLVSSELDEVLTLSDRILVMFGGRIVGEMPGKDADEGRIGRLMAGLTDAEAA